MRGQHLLIPARRRLRDGQRPAYSAAATPAATTDTSDGSGCRFPRALRVSVSRPSSASRSDTGSGTIPAGRWRRMQSVSHDEEPGAAKAVLR